MMIENEPLWKEHRKEMSKLTASLDFKEVWGWVDDKTSEEAIKDLPGAETLTNAQSFLEDLMISHYIPAPDVHLNEGCVIMQWSAHEKQLEVQFRPNNEWNVLFEKSVVEGDGPEPSFWMDYDDKKPKVPHFFLEDRFIKEIEKPQPWSQEYKPQIHPKRIMQCTNYWDGPLEGYCTDSVGNDVYFFECVEEMTYSPRSRMYAVYKLSTWEQVKACINHARWIAVVHTAWFWWLYLFSFRHIRRHGPEDVQRRQEAWRKKHKLLGYFTY